MRVTVDRGELGKKLSLVSHAISNKNQLVVLMNVLIEAKEGKLYLYTTDLEIGIETSLVAKIEDDGSVMVPCKVFSELINSLSDTTIDLVLNDKKLKITGKRSRAELQTLDVNEFPKLYEDKGKLTAVIDGGNLHKNFQPIIISASNDSTRPALTGVLIRWLRDGALLAATDGFRLSLRQMLTETRSTEEKTSLIVPVRVIKEVLYVKGDNSRLNIYFSDDNKQIIFELGETKFVSRVIDADFPDFDKIIPTDFSLRVNFNREELLQACRVCSVFSKDSSNIIKLSIRDKSVRVSSVDSSLGANSVDIEGETSGEENEIAFNSKYLLDLLSSTEEQSMQFEMIGPLNPGVFKIKGDDSFLHLIMPIRTGG